MSAIGDICRTFPERGRKILHDTLVAKHWRFLEAARSLGTTWTGLKKMLKDLGSLDAFEKEAEEYRTRFADPDGKVRSTSLLDRR
jgi:hypothetical protein